jgi:hypothetical protein
LERDEILAFKSLQILASISGWPRGAVVAKDKAKTESLVNSKKI